MSRKSGTRWTATAPLRIDLAGAWTVPLVAERGEGGVVVAFAISLRARAEVFQDTSGYVFGNYSSPMPLGTGLGNNGAMNVVLMAA